MEEVRERNGNPTLGTEWKKMIIAELVLISMTLWLLHINDFLVAKYDFLLNGA